MAKWSAQDKRDLAEHTRWREWGQKFGWRLLGSDGEGAGASFITKAGYRFDVPMEVRADIERVLSLATHHIRRAVMTDTKKDLAADLERAQTQLDRAVEALRMIAAGHGCPSALADDTLKAIENL